MGMTIDEEVKNIKEQLADVSAKYRMMQSDYNARLKADMAAMLTDIQLEIEELYPEHQCTGELTGFADAIETIKPIIQQKIDKLKEQTGARNDTY